MSIVSRAIAGAAALVVAVLCTLLALDVRGWERAFTTGDVRYRAAPGSPRPWRATERLPFHLGRLVLAVEDDLEFREVTRRFRLTQGAGISDTREAQALLKLRAETEADLAAVVDGRMDARRRSLAANMLGVIAYEDSLSGGTESSLWFRRSLKEFRRAIRVDTSNEQAKYNLELLLRLRARQPDLGGGGRGSSSGSDPTQTQAGGAGLSLPGRGY